MKPRRCVECGRPLVTRTADRHRDCYLVWVAGPQPEEPDWVVVERLVAGVRTEATDLERAEAYRRLSARGVPAREIAARLGVTARTVVRWRNRDRVAS